MFSGGELFMAKTLNRSMIMVEILHPAWKRKPSSQDYTLLYIALMIDFVDLLPFNLPGSVFETLFLMYLGVPPVNSVIRGAIDLIPILDWIPWCTLIVLHLRFGVDFGRLNRLLSGKRSAASVKGENGSHRFPTA